MKLKQKLANFFWPNDDLPIPRRIKTLVFMNLVSLWVIQLLFVRPLRALRC